MVKMQRSPFKPEIERFRQYIADKYHHRTVINGEKTDLPITTIYFIEKAFNRSLPAVLYVNNKYYDRLTGIAYEGKRDPLVELLTHDAYFIQAELLPEDFRDDLIRILSIFSPKYRILLGKDDRYIDLPDELINKYKDKVLRLMVKRLQLAEKDSVLITKLDLEKSYEKEWEDIHKALEKERTGNREVSRRAKLETTQR